MTLEDASKERERLENDLRFYENRLETIKSLVEPQATQFDKILVDGGKHIDNMLKYVEIENKEQLEVTILYIQSKINDIDTWINKEIKRLAKYGETVKAVVFLREKEFKTDSLGKKRHLTWEEIARKVYCSERSARTWYKLGTEQRKKST
jgi:hypothetical protein